ncbi:hypothetical protein MSAN_01096700 [Mycena sanguinolenta]|uniref:Uncharacterized protein n=1 Tax=Mycena sanguinolenta TaxID=230812 RepID=A0A8H7DA02_9AGAR|nr:hypothetical protein MSAN_01096700 [Mycena sanguinolenta]
MPPAAQPAASPRPRPPQSTQTPAQPNTIVVTLATRPDGTPAFSSAYSALPKSLPVASSEALVEELHSTLKTLPLEASRDSEAGDHEEPTLYPSSSLPLLSDRLPWPCFSINLDQHPPLPTHEESSPPPASDSREPSFPPAFAGHFARTYVAVVPMRHSESLNRHILISSSSRIQFLASHTQPMGHRRSCFIVVVFGSCSVPPPAITIDERRRTHRKGITTNWHELQLREETQTQCLPSIITGGLTSSPSTSSPTPLAEAPSRLHSLSAYGTPSLADAVRKWIPAPAVDSHFKALASKLLTILKVLPMEDPRGSENIHGMDTSTAWSSEDLERCNGGARGV